MEEQGDLRSGGDVTEGSPCFPPRRQVAPTLPLVFEPLGGRGPPIPVCRGPAGVKGRRGHSPGERGRLRPERTLAKCPALAPMAPAASPASCHAAWSCSPGAGSPQVFAFCGHQGPRAADAFTGRGVGALGDRGLRGHSRFLRSLGQTLESGSCQVQVCRQGAGWGSVHSGKTLNCPGRAQA